MDTAVGIFQPFDRLHSLSSRHTNRRNGCVNGLHSDRQPEVWSQLKFRRSPCRSLLPERSPLVAEQLLAGGEAPLRGAPPGRRGTERQQWFEVEGKIKGAGTSPAEKRVCTWGWRGTRYGAARCREVIQVYVRMEEIACLARRHVLALDAVPRE